MGFFEKISAGLKKTRDSLMGRLEDLAAGFTKVDEDLSLIHISEPTRH